MDGNALIDFWRKLPPNTNIHPEDKPYFDASVGHTFQTAHRPPGPWDGPLLSAKIIICYANPGYDLEDGNRQQLINQQRSGKDALPECWDHWYLPRIRSIRLPIAALRNLVAIFNICPYSSKEMTDRDVRLASGLPSVWSAQAYLRTALIPAAHAGEIFLVIARKHQLWGVVEGGECKTMRLIRNRAGYLTSIGAEIRSWLIEKGHYKS